MNNQNQKQDIRAQGGDQNRPGQPGQPGQQPDKKRGYEGDKFASPRRDDDERNNPNKRQGA